MPYEIWAALHNCGDYYDVMLKFRDSLSKEFIPFISTCTDIAKRMCAYKDWKQHWSTVPTETVYLVQHLRTCDWALLECCLNVSAVTEPISLLRWPEIRPVTHLLPHQYPRGAQNTFEVTSSERLVTWPRNVISSGLAVNRTAYGYALPEIHHCADSHSQKHSTMVFPSRNA